MPSLFARKVDEVLTGTDIRIWSARSPRTIASSGNSTAIGIAHHAFPASRGKAVFATSSTAPNATVRISGIRQVSDDWLAVLVANRDVQVTTPIQIEAKKQLLERFLPDFSKADIIRGYRADDSYFSFARAFLGNEISLRQLSLAMRLGKLGEQIVIKSKRAFGRLRYKGNVLAEAKAYYPKRLARDKAARAAFQTESTNPDLDGIFMRDILCEHMGRDDARLR